VIEHTVLQGKGLLPMKTVLAAMVASVHTYSLLSSASLFMFFAVLVFS